MLQIYCVNSFYIKKISYSLKFKNLYHKQLNNIFQQQNYSKMLHIIHNNQNDLSYQNLRNKTTVKKQNNLPLILKRNNSNPGKQNQYNQININSQNNKTIERKIQQENLNNSVCANHQDRDAQFIVQIEGDILNYCRKCASHIASQGFQVQKVSQINQQVSVNRRLTLNQNISPNRLRQKQPLKNSRKLELTQFTKQLKNLRKQYIHKNNQLAQICQTYQIQKQNISHYYASLIEYIQDMRDTHLQAIEEQGIKSTQICQIQAGQVQQNIKQIDSIVWDIQQNLQNIVNEVNDDNYNQCLQFYRQKEGVFNHRLEELGFQAKPWNCTEKTQLANKYESFKIFLDQLHGLHEGYQNQTEESEIQNY